MDFANAIKKAIWQINSKSNYSYTDKQRSNLLEQVLLKIEEGDFSFDEAVYMKISKNKEKVRSIKKFKEFSIEDVLSEVVKDIIDENLKIKYPNRNLLMKSIFSYLPILTSLTDFTIYRFDFKDYFNSLSAMYIFEKYIGRRIQDREAFYLVQKYCKETKRCYAGLRSSNVMAEVIAQEFDREVKQKMQYCGLVFYGRYVDDGIFILNKYVDKKVIENNLSFCLQKIFKAETLVGKKNRTELNNEKKKCVYLRSFKYESAMYSNKTPQIIKHEFDFLGYLFVLSYNDQNKLGLKLQIACGVTATKREKYKNKIIRIIQCYKNENALPKEIGVEILRQRLAIFTRRIVYQKKFHRSVIWNVHGFIHTYGQLRDLIISNLAEKEEEKRKRAIIIEESTRKWMESVVVDSFQECEVPLPYFMSKSRHFFNGYSNSEVEIEGYKYNLLYNMNHNRSVVLVDEIGYSLDAFRQLVMKIGLESKSNDGEDFSYGFLIRKYLSKIFECQKH